MLNFYDVRVMSLLLGIISVDPLHLFGSYQLRLFYINCI